MKRRYKNLILISTALLLAISQKGVFAEELKSGAYEKWNSLSDEEKSSTIAPIASTVVSSNLEERIDIENSVFTDKQLLLGYTRFDLRRYQSIEDRSQTTSNSAWAAETTRMLELFMANVKRTPGTKFSSAHMDYATRNDQENGHYRWDGSGGNALVGMGYLTSGKGPIYEGSDSTVLKVEDYRVFRNVYKNYEYGVWTHSDRGNTYYTPGEVETNRQEIKEQIVNYGGVTSAIVRDEAYFKYYYTEPQYYTYTTRGNKDGTEIPKTYTIRSGTKYIKYNDVSYYYNNKNATPNHMVTLIGFDDDYQVPGAPNPGAYIAVDSVNFAKQWYNYTSEGWEASIQGGAYVYKHFLQEEGKWVSITDGEYVAYTANDEYRLDSVDTKIYYIAYDDYYVESNVVGINSTDYALQETTYQHDPLGISTTVTDESYMPEAYGANVFDRIDTTKGENLNSISIANLAEMSYEVYVNPYDGDLDEEKFVKVKDDTGLLKPGYHTIDLDESLLLTGDKFVVAVKYKSNDKYQPAIMGVESPNIQYWQTATAKEGQSYFGTTIDSMVDMTTKYANTNLCIKAYTTPAYYVPVQNITLNKSEITLVKGEVETLEAKVSPEIAQSKTVYWSSDNSAVASVQNGKITALKGGSATITARSADGKVKAECKVEVIVPVQGISLNTKQITMVGTEAQTLVATITPEDATNKNIIWKSNNSAVAKVNQNGVLIGLGKGKTKIKATTEDGGFVAECEVTVPEALVVSVQDVELKQKTLSIQVGEKVALDAVITPTDATDKDLVWTSSNKLAATVNTLGKVTGLAEGTTTITVTTVDGGQTDTCKVTVTPKKEVSPTSVTLNQSNTSIAKTYSEVLIATVYPENADNKEINWESSNSNVARVTANGKVTAVDYGTAVITATTKDGGKTAKCVVTVPGAVETSVTGIKLDRTSSTMKIGESTMLIATVSPTNATNKKIEWTSSNPNIATVDSLGTVVAKEKGSTLITAKTLDGDYKETCLINVLSDEKVSKITLDNTELELTEGRSQILVYNIEPEDVVNKNVKWESSNTEVVIVNENGKITGVKEGTATITVTPEDGEEDVLAKCNVTVKATDRLQIMTGGYILENGEYITRINPNTTKKDLLNKIIVIKENEETSEYEELSDITKVIVNADGTKLEKDEDIIGTGMKLIINDTEEYTLTVIGDLTGEGCVTATGITALKNHLADIKILSDEYKKAADINYDGKIDLLDLSLLKQLLLKEIEL